MIVDGLRRFASLVSSNYQHQLGFLTPIDQRVMFSNRDEKGAMRFGKLFFNSRLCGPFL